MRTPRGRRGHLRRISRSALLLAASLVTPARAEEGTYVERLVNQITKFRRYPESAAALTIAGTTLVRFKLSRDGKLLLNEVKQTSGDEDLDKAALEALERGQPFPAAPPEMPDERLDFVVPIVFKYVPDLVTSVTGNLHVGAFMTGMCGLTAAGVELSCGFAAFYLNRAGVSYYRMPVAGFGWREIWFSGSTVQITGTSYRLSIDRVLLRSRLQDRDENSEKPVKGSCTQIGNFTRRRVSTISCEATDEAGNKYTANFATDGSAVKVMRDTDERLPVQAK